MYRHISVPEQIAYELGYKGSLVKQWLIHKTNVPPSALLSEVCLKTRVSQGKSRLDSIEDSGKYWKVKFKGLQSLFYPKNLPLYDLYIVAGENYAPANWHYYAIPETKITKDDIVVDCGAAVGTFTLSILHAKKIYAIEPLPKFVEAMSCTFKKNKNVSILPVAVGEREGKLSMFDGSFGSIIDNRENGVKVKVTTIDNLFYNKGQRVTYIKADLEGWDLEMLKGAEKTIKKNRPKIAITTYHKKNDHIKITKFLKKIHPTYNIKWKGIDKLWGNPVMLHAW